MKEYKTFLKTDKEEEILSKKIENKVLKYSETKRVGTRIWVYDVFKRGRQGSNF